MTIRQPSERFRALFEPRGIVVAGAATHPGKFGFVAYHNLRAAGYDFVGGEAHDGMGWPSWRNRTDALLEALFPLEEEP